jgi:hypothetical protein
VEPKLGEAVQRHSQEHDPDQPHELPVGIRGSGPARRWGSRR